MRSEDDTEAQWGLLYFFPLTSRPGCLYHQQISTPCQQCHRECIKQFQFLLTEVDPIYHMFYKISLLKHHFLSQDLVNLCGVLTTWNLTEKCTPLPSIITSRQRSCPYLLTQKPEGGPGLPTGEGSGWEICLLSSQWGHEKEAVLRGALSGLPSTVPRASWAAEGRSHPGDALVTLHASSAYEESLNKQCVRGSPSTPHLFLLKVTFYSHFLPVQHNCSKTKTYKWKKDKKPKFQRMMPCYLTPSPCPVHTHLAILPPPQTPSSSVLLPTSLSSVPNSHTPRSCLWPFLTFMPTICSSSLLLVTF